MNPGRPLPVDKQAAPNAISGLLRGQVDRWSCNDTSVLLALCEASPGQSVASSHLSQLHLRNGCPRTSLWEWGAVRRAVRAPVALMVSRITTTRLSSSPQGISRCDPPALAHVDSFGFTVTWEASEAIILGSQMKKVTVLSRRNLPTAKEQSWASLTPKIPTSG